MAKQTGRVALWTWQTEGKTGRTKFFVPTDGKPFQCEVEAAGIDVSLETIDWFETTFAKLQSVGGTLVFYTRPSPIAVFRISHWDQKRVRHTGGWLTLTDIRAGFRPDQVAFFDWLNLNLPKWPFSP